MRREHTTTDELLRNFVAAFAVIATVTAFAFIAAIVGRLL